MTDRAIIVLTTVPDLEEGKKLAHGLVKGRLAACVQILPAMTSVYEWEQKIQEETEHLLLIKTIAERFSAVSSYISQNHSYSVPEIMSVSADETSGPYMEWLRTMAAI